MTCRALERFETPQLLLARPTESDVQEVFDRYASDAEVVTYLSFPRHRTIADTHAFITISDREWSQCPAGEFLIRLRADGKLIGGTGLSFETRWRATTGYVLAKDSWGMFPNLAPAEPIDTDCYTIIPSDPSTPLGAG